MLWWTERSSRLSTAFIEPCLPAVRLRPPVGSEWLHEFKHDGCRLVATKSGRRVQLFTRRGFDWTRRFPRIAEAMQSLPLHSVAIDGEAVVCGADGVAVFEKLASNTKDAFLFAFDLVELNGVDLRPAPLEKRKQALAKLIRQAKGMRFVEHLEGDGEIAFKRACKIGFEGIVSKRRDLPYHSGRSQSWLQIKNPVGLALRRAHIWRS
jgi:bifunctional non-homologous end joining protein LigD